MMTRKICMIGDFAVGKTSLVARFVHSTFSSEYHTTIGVKVDSKLVALPSGDSLKLILWDIAGNDALSSVEQTYLRGAAGFLLVADSTRRETLDSAIRLKQQTETVLGEKPFVLVLNKIDLDSRYELPPDRLQQLASSGWSQIQGSALSGQGVETAFQRLGEKMVVTL